MGESFFFFSFFFPAISAIANQAANIDRDSNPSNLNCQHSPGLVNENGIFTILSFCTSFTFFFSAGLQEAPMSVQGGGKGSDGAVSPKIVTWGLDSPDPIVQEIKSHGVMRSFSVFGNPGYPSHPSRFADLSL